MTTISRAPYELDVSEASEAIASGDLSVWELNRALVERVDALEPLLNAFAYWDRDAWLAAAKVLDTEARAGKLRGPLHGIPVGIKDQFRVGGWPCKIGTTWGETGVSAEDSTAVARLRAAGAIIAGITYMPDRDGNPPSCNPWNLAHTPGGSSSGSAAAVGGRLVPLAMGESTGGSGIRPPAFCGVDALKPTYRRISGEGLYVIAWSLDHPTVIGRSFEDIALAYNAVAGPDADDPTSNPAPFTPVSIDAATLSPPRIGFVRNHFLEKADDEMQEAMELAATKLGEAGAEVVDVTLPDDFALVWPAWKLVCGAERSAFHALHAGKLMAQGIEVAPDVDSLIPGLYYLQAQRVRRWLTQLTLPLFDQVDFLFTPASVGPAPEGHGGGDNVMNSPWATVEMPAITFNIGLAASGLSLGAQLSARHLAEEPLLHAGTWCESVLGRLPTPEVTRSS